MNRFALILLTTLALAALGGVVFVALPFVMPAAPKVATPVSAALPETQPFEEIMDRALAGYNARDAATLFADFASSAVPAPTPEVYRALFEGYYHAAFGLCRDRKLSVKDTEILPDRALLVWDAAFSLEREAKLSANFIRENGQPKIVQIRIEKVEPAK